MNATNRIMKGRGLVTGLAVAAAIALGMTPAANADDKGCTNASLKGAFVFTTTGSIVTPAAFAGPIGEVGVQFFDGKGTTTATATLSQNGNIVPLTITGNYTVNPDCTGTMLLMAAPIGQTFHVYFALADGLNQIQAIEAEQGLVVTRVYRRQFPVGDIRN